MLSLEESDLGREFPDTVIHGASHLRRQPAWHPRDTSHDARLSLHHIHPLERLKNCPVPPIGSRSTSMRILWQRVLSILISSVYRLVMLPPIYWYVRFYPTPPGIRITPVLHSGHQAKLLIER